MSNAVMKKKKKKRTGVGSSPGICLSVNRERLGVDVVRSVWPVSVDNRTDRTFLRSVLQARLCQTKNEWQRITPYSPQSTE